jgi:uncharacterized membrane protein YjgN (DUF898 family)
MAAFAVAGIIAALIGLGSAMGGSEPNPTFLAIIFGLFLAVYLIIPLMTLNWYAAFYRKAADELSLGDLEFGFDASTWDWLKLFLGNIGLAIVTLGFGLAFWGYRNWAFMIRHFHLYGEVDASRLTQSTTHAPGEAEGFADAFDIGAL